MIFRSGQRQWQCVDIGTRRVVGVGSIAAGTFAAFATGRSDAADAGTIFIDGKGDLLRIHCGNVK